MRKPISVVFVCGASPGRCALVWPRCGSDGGSACAVRVSRPRGGGGGAVTRIVRRQQATLGAIVKPPHHDVILRLPVPAAGAVPYPRRRLAQPDVFPSSLVQTLQHIQNRPAVVSTVVILPKSAEVKFPSSRCRPRGRQRGNRCLMLPGL